MISDKTLGSDVYTDFTGFESMRKAARENSPEAVSAVAKKLEGMFLNMMLSSMREANQVLSQDSLMSSKDVKFYEGMLDQQLTTNLSSGKGIGLADVIARQLGADKQSSSKSITDPIGPSQVIQRSKYPLPIEQLRVIADVNGSKADAPNAVEKLPEASSASLVTESADNIVSDTPQSPEEFIEMIGPYAKDAAEKLGIPHEAILAQAALETGWGKHGITHDNGMSARNYFGIKADSRWQGDTVDITTTEYRQGVAAKETASFRSYPSIAAAFDDYVDFLTNSPRYAAAISKTSQSMQANDWGHYLHESGYATDPNYGKKIAGIVLRLQKTDTFMVSRSAQDSSRSPL